MIIVETPAGVLIREYTNFSLEQTLDCGQCFRFSKKADGGWHGVAGNRPLTLRQSPDGLLFENISKEEFEGFWRTYFDLDRNYAAICKEYTANSQLCECIGYASGIRVLRQDAWEALISFIISQNNNVPRIKGIIDRLCCAFGEPIGNAEGDYSFPASPILTSLSKEDLAVLRCGWRDAYILDAARQVSSGAVDLAAVSKMPIEQARRELQRIQGVGPKVAECVLLYGMGRMEAFPLDVWMKRAMKVLFPGCTPEDFGKYAGVAQQYIFHYCRCHADAIK